MTHMNSDRDVVEGEMEWRKAIADQVRRNCTPSSEAYAKGGDVLIYAVADWIENPPEWSHLTLSVGGEPTEHKITQRIPWPPYPEANHMISLFECSCGWTGRVFTDTQDNRTAIKNCRQIAEAHAAALGGGGEHE